MKHGGTVLDSLDGLTVIECTECGFRHLSPLPTEEETAAYYKTEYTGKRPDYIATLEEDLEWWRLQYRKKYEVLEKLVPHPERRLLDVGCGLGRFMESGEKRLWFTSGIEPSKDSAVYARKLGFTAVEASLEQASHQIGENWGVVHSHEVLEHIPNPKHFLYHCYSILRSEGILCLTVPNDYNPLQLALKKTHGPYWLNKEHINYFRPSSLKLLVESVGFKVEKVEMSFPMELFLLMGADYTKNKQQGRYCHKMRCELDFNLDKAGFHIPEAFKTVMSGLNWGREVTVYARKF